jgi:hypothetical protein
MSAFTAATIPSEVLSEQYHLLLHDLVSQLQHRFREIDLTQKQIGGKIHKQPAVVSRCLAGQENMTVRTMHDLARGMNCRLEISLQPLDKLRPSNRPIQRASEPYHNTEAPYLSFSGATPVSPASLTVQIPPQVSHANA